MPPSKVELYAAIRRDARAGMSGRAIEKKYRVGRRTVGKALASAWPEQRKQLPPRASKLDPFKPVIDEILKADLDAPRKQRHTITRIWRRLMDEHGMADVSYPVVRAYVAERKPQVRVEAGRGPAEVFVPQSHRPGDEAEVDFGECRGPAGRGGRQVLPVLPAAVFLRQGGAPGLAVGRAGGVLRGPRARVPRAGRGPGREDPLRQPQGRGRAGHRAQPVAGREPTGGPRSAPTGAWTPSTASPASTAPTRKAGWRARSAGSAATTWSRFPDVPSIQALNAMIDAVGRRRRGPADRRPGADRRGVPRGRAAAAAARCRRSRSRPACG